MLYIDKATDEELTVKMAELESEYQNLKTESLELDLTRGKPNTDQVALSNELDGILKGNYRGEDGTDLQNYGGIDGIVEAKTLFSQILDLRPENTLVGGNSSLTLMFQLLVFALNYGVDGS